ncbi:hypothetical protein RRF57_006475 [Xylaria bambusicola]|uniref:Uncharacterized protein n=1 Tax=Xylaria bambusicola TaxID=326684 RepID=A0AAN7UEG1_9PEZI
MAGKAANRPKRDNVGASEENVLQHRGRLDGHEKSRVPHFQRKLTAPAAVGQVQRLQGTISPAGQLPIV